jgi:hypothetical protein
MRIFLALPPMASQGQHKWRSAERQRLFDEPAQRLMHRPGKAAYSIFCSGALLRVLNRMTTGSKGFPFSSAKS